MKKLIRCLLAILGAFLLFTGLVAALEYGDYSADIFVEYLAGGAVKATLENWTFFGPPASLHYTATWLGQPPVQSFDDVNCQNGWCQLTGEIPFGMGASYGVCRPMVFSETGAIEGGMITATFSWRGETKIVTQTVGAAHVPYTIVEILYYDGAEHFDLYAPRYLAPQITILAQTLSETWTITPSWYESPWERWWSVPITIGEDWCRFEILGVTARLLEEEDSDWTQTKVGAPLVNEAMPQPPTPTPTPTSTPEPPTYQAFIPIVMK